MRLLVVTQYFWPENFRINDLVTELVERGHQVTVLTGVPNYPDGRVPAEFLANRRAFDSFNGARIVRVPLCTRGAGGLRLVLNYLSFALNATLLGAWKLRGLRFDAIFAYEPSPITIGIPATVLRRIKRAPLALWVLDLWPETLVAVGVLRSGLLLKCVGRLVTYIYDRCDLILAQSKSFVPQIRKYCSGATPVVYFPSWAETVFDLRETGMAEEVPVRPGSFDVMFAGNVGDAQDFPSILAAAEVLKPHAHIRWLIVGDGRMAGWVRAEIARRQLDACVIMLGRHAVDRMPAFYRHADVLLVSLKDTPIFSMTIPGKLQSYLATGIPIVAMLNGEGADLVQRAHAGLACNAGDAAGLAAAVLELSSLAAEQLAQMGRNALATSESEFGRSELISRLENLMASLRTGVSAKHAAPL